MMEKTMKQIAKSIKTIASISLLILTFNSQASDLTIPNQFTSGTRAVAADVNANFDAAAVAVTDNQTQLTDLIAQITALTATVTALQAEVDTLKADSVAGLSGVLNVSTDNQGNSAAIFSGVNLHVNNGTGSTLDVNGLGNLIIGYDAASNIANETCADGQYPDQTTCEDNGEIWADGHKSGSHNLVIGYGHSYSQSGGLIAGSENTISALAAVALGGGANIASGKASVVIGGLSNIASGFFSSIGGGSGNMASGFKSSISGGRRNISSGEDSSVSGGSENEASALNSAVSGGNSNQASGNDSSISGGGQNIASGYRSSVSGGAANDASNSGSAVSGGVNNTASGEFSSVSGGNNRAAVGFIDWRAGTLFEDN